MAKVIKDSVIENVGHDHQATDDPRSKVYKPIDSNGRCSRTSITTSLIASV